MRRTAAHALAALGFTIGLFAVSSAAFSAERTVALNVKMWCASCPYIVKRTLQDVSGVTDVTVFYERQQAVVRFDDERTSVAALTKATADVGFPSTLASGSQ